MRKIDTDRVISALGGDRRAARWFGLLTQPTTMLVWRAVQDHWDEYGCGPSYRELAQRAYVSKSSVSLHLNRLDRAGVIVWWPGLARGIKLVVRVPLEGV